MSKPPRPTICVLLLTVSMGVSFVGCGNGSGFAADTGGLGEIADVPQSDDLDVKGNWSEKLIGPEGGTLELPGGGLLVVPPTALNSAQLIRAQAVAPPVLDQFTQVGPFHRFSPAGLQFLNPAWLILASTAQLSETDGERAVLAWSQDGTQWTLASVFRTEDNTSFVAPLNHFSEGGLAIPAPAANLECCVFGTAQETDANLMAQEDCLAQGGRLSSLGDCDPVCCWYSATFEARSVARALCDATEGQIDGDPSDCNVVCCSKGSGSDKFTYIASSIKCKDDQGTEVSSNECDTVCCIVGNTSATLETSGTCAAKGGFTSPHDIEGCDSVCCQTGGQGVQLDASVLPAALCELAMGTPVDGEWCDNVCCNTGAFDAAVMSAAACSDRGGNAYDDTSLCDSVCCEYSGTTSSIPAYTCEDVGKEVDQEECNKVCCVSPGPLEDASVMTASACEASGGESVGAWTECDPVCCGTASLPAAGGEVVGAYVVSKAECVSEGGVVIADPEACDQVCCEVGPGEYVVLTRDMCELSGSTTVGDSEVCNIVCCGLDGDIGLIDAIVMTEHECSNEEGVPVGGDSCESVCCALTDSHSAVTSAAECLYLGGTDAGAEVECERVCCSDGDWSEVAYRYQCEQPAVTSPEPSCWPVCCSVTASGTTVFDTVPEVLCVDPLGSKADESSCAEICCSAGSEAFLTTRGTCLSDGGTELGPPGGCEVTCCTIETPGVPTGIPLAEALCLTVGQVVDDQACEDVCCIQGPDARVVSSDQCAKDGGVTSGTPEDCEPTCCSTTTPGSSKVTVDVRPLAACDPSDRLTTDMCEPVCCFNGLSADVVPKGQCTLNQHELLGGSDQCGPTCCSDADEVLLSTLAFETPLGLCPQARRLAPEQCEEVCCGLGDEAEVLPSGTCSGIGGTALGDAQACDKVCCADLESPLTSFASMEVAAMCPQEWQQDYSECEPVCCVVGGEHELLPLALCKLVGAQAGPAGSCDPVCCRLGDTTKILPYISCLELSAFDPMPPEDCTSQYCCRVTDGTWSVVAGSQCDSAAPWYPKEVCNMLKCCMPSPNDYREYMVLPEFACDFSHYVGEPAECSALECCNKGYEWMAAPAAACEGAESVAGVAECTELLFAQLPYSANPKHYYAESGGGVLGLKVTESEGSNPIILLNSSNFNQAGFYYAGAWLAGGTWAYWIPSGPSVPVVDGQFETKQDYCMPEDLGSVMCSSQQTWAMFDCCNGGSGGGRIKFSGSVGPGSATVTANYYEYSGSDPSDEYITATYTRQGTLDRSVFVYQQFGTGGFTTKCNELSTGTVESNEHGFNCYGSMPPTGSCMRPTGSTITVRTHIDEGRVFMFWLDKVSHDVYLSNPATVTVGTDAISLVPFCYSFEKMAK